jgi:hypothetical protein
MSNIPHESSSLLELLFQKRFNHPMVDEDDIKDILVELDKISRMSSPGDQLVELIKVFDLHDISAAILIQHLLCNTVRLYGIEAMMQFDNILANFTPRTIQ